MYVLGDAVAFRCDVRKAIAVRCGSLRLLKRGDQGIFHGEGALLELECSVSFYRSLQPLLQSGERMLYGSFARLQSYWD